MAAGNRMPAGFGKLMDDDMVVLANAIGCTYDGCQTGDPVWLVVRGKEGTPAEGQYACLCETHTKEMVAPPEGLHEWAAKINYVEIPQLGYS